jgi:tellurite resistance protein
MTHSVTPQEALIYVMVTISAADASMSDSELMRIGDVVRTLPAFRKFNQDEILLVAQAASGVLGGDNGLEKMLDVVADALPVKLHDTAYAMAVEIAASDLNVNQEELRFLQMLRDRLGLDKLTIAAIERSAQARFRTL